MRPHDLIFDTLTFTLGSGDEEFRRAGDRNHGGHPADQEGTARGQDPPGRQQHLLRPVAQVRHVLNSVFLHYAIEAGLDMAIVHAAKIMPLYKIDERGRELCRQLIFDERKFEEVAA